MITFHLKRRWTLRGRQWYFYIRSRNGKTLCSSELYHNKCDAMDTMHLIAAGADDAEWIEEIEV